MKSLIKKNEIKIKFMKMYKILMRYKVILYKFMIYNYCYINKKRKNILKYTDYFIFYN